MYRDAVIHKIVDDLYEPFLNAVRFECEGAEKSDNCRKHLAE